MQPRPPYALARRFRRDGAGEWTVDIRRVSYDVAAAVAALDRGLRAAHPAFAHVLALTLRTADDHYRPWLRAGRPSRIASLPAVAP